MLSHMLTVKIFSDILVANVTNIHVFRLNVEVILLRVGETGNIIEYRFQKRSVNQIRFRRRHTS